MIAAGPAKAHRSQIVRHCTWIKDEVHAIPSHLIPPRPHADLGGERLPSSKLPTKPPRSLMLTGSASCSIANSPIATTLNLLGATGHAG
jgi:hypothetical protein